MVSSCFMAVRALGLPLPPLAAASSDGSCGLCGVPIRKGVTPAKLYQPTAEFAAFEHLHPNRSGWICAACVVVTSSASGLMTRHSRAVFTANKAYRMSNAADICWMLQHATPPFVAVFNTRASAHVLWQAPVTHDRAVIGVVVGSTVGTIRSQAVLSAHAALGRLADAANKALGTHYHWPVFNLSLYGDLVDACRLNPLHESMLRSSANPKVMGDLCAFDDLNPTERWALSALLLARPKRGQSIASFDEPPILEKKND